jgi:hypothetical protein
MRMHLFSEQLVRGFGYIAVAIRAAARLRSNPCMSTRWSTNDDGTGALARLFLALSLANGFASHRVPGCVHSELHLHQIARLTLPPTSYSLTQLPDFQNCECLHGRG